MCVSQSSLQFLPGITQTKLEKPVWFEDVTAFKFFDFDFSLPNVLSFFSSNFSWELFFSFHIHSIWNNHVWSLLIAISQCFMKRIFQPRFNAVFFRFPCTTNLLRVYNPESAQTTLPTIRNLKTFNFPTCAKFSVSHLNSSHRNLFANWSQYFPPLVPLLRCPHPGPGLVGNSPTFPLAPPTRSKTTACFSLPLCYFPQGFID